MESDFDSPSSEAYNHIANLFVFRIERHMVMRELRRLCPQGILLDIGCGPGHLTREILQKFSLQRVIGLDISKDMLRLAARNLPAGRVELIPGDVRALPLADASIDFAVSSGSLHHWADAVQGFKEISRVLRAGGRFLTMDLRRDAPLLVYRLVRMANVFAPAELKRTKGALGSFYTAYTPEEIRKILSTIPFSTWQVRAGFAWMFIEGSR